MAGRSRPKRSKVRGNSTKAHFASGLAEIVSETVRLWHDFCWRERETVPQTIGDNHINVYGTEAAIQGNNASRR